ncbi:glycosyltransferase [Streptomyces sp. NBS 14/10]|uniref:glycosyltransferase family 2 protein n=1 Tax=Streptomyces sp. NBS 14/10 TaxID=1945643 RepID=UPI000B7CDA11|nr:glycosyltransferase [Streptomyces sp. NBS 14/10]KAK1178173.1 glycosyltransferase [Streptomyces sp. NBS 14/10]
MSRRLVSLVTPVHGPAVSLLPEAYASLAQQELPEGWDWQWLVQEDGEGVNAAAHLPGDDPRISIDFSRRGGPQVARTMAFARSCASGESEFIKVLDADDRLTPGALARDIDVLTRYPEVGWTTSRALDLLPDGSTVGFEGDPEKGVLPAGSVWQYWQLNKRAQVHPATLCARRDLMLVLGGWMALPASGDTGLLLGLDALADGWFHDEVGLLYRKHADQITQHPFHSQGPEWEARMRIIEEHTRALRSVITSRDGSCHRG